MDIKNTLANWYSNRSGTDSVFRSTSLEFPEISIDQCIKDLNVVNEAKEDGEKNIPLTNDESISASEERYRVRFLGDKAYHTNMALAVVDSKEKEAFKHDLEKKGAAFKGFELEVDNSHNNLISDIRDQKLEVEEQLKAVQKEFDEFKSDNKLDRTARSPRSKLRIYSIIAAMILIETIINGIFFASGIGSGFKGATIAICLSGINVFAGLVIGRKVLNYKNHISLFFKFLAYIGFLSYMFLVLFLNLFIAWWRDLSSSGLDITFRDAQLKLISEIRNPIGFEQTDSLIFLLVGVGFSLYALYEGYTSEDPYPGYGLMYSRLEEARDNYQGQKEGALKEVDELREHFLADIINKSDAIKSSYKATTQCINEIETFLTRFNTYCKQIDKYCFVVLKTYRDENKKVRSDTPPKYFDNKEVIEEIPNINNRLNELKEICNKSKSTVDSQQAILEKMDKYVWTISNKTRKEFEDLENF